MKSTATTQSVPSKNPNAFFNYSGENLKNPQLVPANDNRTKRAWMLRKYYITNVKTLISSGMSFNNILRHQYPYLLKDAHSPLGLQLEFTNYCNIACCYCTNAIDERPKGYLSAETLEKVISDIKLNKIKRLSIVGNGEATLHPNFNDYLKLLKPNVNFISLTSNLQFNNDSIINTIAKTVGILNVSVDGCSRFSYEKYRKNASFERLILNIDKLKRIRKDLKKQVNINIRIMIHPSNQKDIKDLKKFWSKYADVVTTQYVLNFKHLRDDVFDFNTNIDYYPSCSLPFKKLDIHWNGDIPLCSYYYMQANTPSEFILGNINSMSLNNIWNSSLIKQYRDAHKQKHKSDIPLCAGCMGC